MLLQGRNLTQGLAGADIASLQQTLVSLGYTIASDEIGQSSFGASTLAAVQAFQKAAGIAVTGQVTDADAQALSSAVGAISWTVSGQVTAPGSAGVGVLAATIVDKNIGGDVTLASAQTDASGKYQIAVPVSAVYLREHGKASPDLQARVSAVAANGSQTFLAGSDIAYDAPKSVTLDVTLPAGSSGLRSEYETLTAAVGVYYSKDLSALQENAQSQDLTFLGNRTGFDVRLLAMSAQAAQLAESISATTGGGVVGPPPDAPAPPAAPPSPPAPSVPPIAPVIAVPPVTPAAGTAAIAPAVAPNIVVDPIVVRLQPQFYYALLRGGLAADPAQLFRASSASVAAIWTQAVAQGVIPASLAVQIPQATTIWQVLAAAQMTKAITPPGGSPIATQVAPILPNTAQQSQFAGLLAQYAGDSDGLWAAVEKAFPEQAPQLRVLGRLNYLTLNNAPLANVLAAKVGAAATSLAGLAGAGLYEAEAWTPLIGQSVPSGIPGASVAEQAANYAAFLAAQVKLAYPTAVLAAQVSKGTVPVTSQQDVSAFLVANQEVFAIGAEPVDAFIARSKAKAPSAEALGQIRRLQRVYQLTTGDEAMAVLLHHQLDSAYAISRYDSAGFARALGPELGGEAAALAIHARARQVFNAVLNIVSRYGLALRAPALGGGWEFTGNNSANAVKLAETSPPEATLQQLFGSLDYCGCSDCGSILSPAAYFVDLLHFLDQPAPTTGFENPQDALFARRPDLQELALSCANTNTELPYIDIVNEVLEAYVAGGDSLQGFTGFNTADTIASADLVAAPQNVNDAAYAALQARFFPAPLPFNRSLELLRRHLSVLGVALPDAMTLLRANDALTVTGTEPATAYGWQDIAIERLGFSRDEARLFTDATLRADDLWGLPYAASESAATRDTNALAALQGWTLKELSTQTGISYGNLVAILKTRYINPATALIERVEALGIGFDAIAALHADPTGTAAQAFIDALPAGLDFSQYGGTDGSAVVSWLTGPNYVAIMGLITIAPIDPKKPDLCDGANLGLFHADPTARALTLDDYTRLIRFIRLWRKLQVTLAIAGDHTAIHLSDALLAALYPTTAASPTDAFATALTRAGFVAELLGRLGLDAGAVLPLLACWAPIDSIGNHSLFDALFLTPTLLQQDPGAQAAIITAPLAADDILSTTIAGVALIYKVSAADVAPPATPASAAAAIAAKIAAAVNADASPIPAGQAYAGDALNARFHATSNGPKVVITAGFKLMWTTSGGAGTLTVPAVTDPTTQAVAIGSSLAVNQIFSVSIDGAPASYTTVVGDSAFSVAQGLASAINAVTTPHPASGLPLNSLLVAAASSTSPTQATITVRTAGAGAPFDLACAITLATPAAYATATPVPTKATVTLSGAPITGETVTLTVTLTPGAGIAVPYTIAVSDTNLPTLAANLAHAVSNAIGLDATYNLPLSKLVTATSSGAVVTITPLDPSTPFALGASASGTLGLTVAGPNPASASATIAGTFPAGVVLTTIIDGASLYYAVTAADTPSSIAAAIAARINAATLADPLTGNALNTVVGASALGATVTVRALAVTTSFTLQTSAAQGGYAAGRLSPPFADNGHGAYLTDPSQTLFAHEPLICAACSLTGPEFANITAALGFDAATALSLDTVSAVFRCGWLAHRLAISVSEFLALRSLSGLDPFASLDPASTAPAEPPAIRFVRFVQKVQAAGLTPAQTIYLAWNDDPTGTQGPNAALLATLAQALRADFAAVEAQFTVQDDPTGAIAQQLMALAYGASDTAFFFSLLNQTFSVSMPFSEPTGVMPAALVSAAKGLLVYDDTAKTLTALGWLTDITSLVTAAAGDAALVAALPTLANLSQQAVAPFFARYPELLPPYQNYMAALAGGTPLADCRTALLAAILPALIRLRKIEQALAEVTAQTGCDPSFADALLQDALVLHADGDPTRPAVGDLTAIEAGGLTAQLFLHNDQTQPADVTIAASGPVAYPASSSAGPFAWSGGGTLPAGLGGGGTLSARWSGFITPPQTGDYDIGIAVTPGASVTLTIDSHEIRLAAANGILTNQTAITLTVGKLTSIVLAVTSATGTVVLGWRSAPGLGWTPIPAAALFPQSPYDALQATYIRFAKAVSLATSLALTANEIAWLGTDTTRAVETTSTSTVAAGPTASFVTASVANLAVGEKLVIDTGSGQELVSVASVTADGFTAATTLAHNGSAIPFAIISQPQAALNRGWLNRLAGAPQSVLDAATASTLAVIFRDVLDFARIKRALSASDERLLQVLEAPDALLANGQGKLVGLTGWSPVSLVALLARLFQATSLGVLGDVPKFARAFDAMQLVKACRVTAPTLLAVITNVPKPAAVATLQSALRASYAAADWLGVIQPINNALRRLQRDALVAAIIQASAGAFATADDLYAHFLIDPLTEPAVLTSRIRLALSAVQLFIERMVRSLEPEVASSDVDPEQWEWMKRYRVWQANREVFLWPENWLDPPLRDDQSPIFRQVMSGLLQGDITDDAAAQAYLDYLGDLADVAKLEPCGVFYVAATPDSDEAAYVVARSFGAHRKYYFRQLSGGTWSPWDQITIDAEDMPVTPIVWNGRLLVFWLKAHKDSASASSTPASSPGQNAASAASNGGSVTAGTIANAVNVAASNSNDVTIQATLWWSEYYNGKWQSPKSSDPNRPTTIGVYDGTGASSFDAYRDQLRIVPATCSGHYPFADDTGAIALPDVSDALILAISTPVEPFPLWADTRRFRPGHGRTPPGFLVHRNNAPGFLLHNTYAAPIRLEDIPVGGLDLGAYLDVPAPYRNFVTSGGPAQSSNGGPPTYTGGLTTGSLQIRYFGTVAEVEGATPEAQPTVMTYDWLPRIVDVQPGLATARTAPFFYEDRRNLFYATSTFTQVTFRFWGGFGLPVFEPLVNQFQLPPLQTPSVPDPASRITFTLPGADPVKYQGTLVFADGGQFAAPAQPLTEVAS